MVSSATPGLSGVLSGGNAADYAVRTVQLAGGVTIDVIACGKTPHNPAELLGSSMMVGVVLNDYDVRRDSKYGNSYYQYDKSYSLHYAAYADDKA